MHLCKDCKHMKVVGLFDYKTCRARPEEHCNDPIDGYIDYPLCSTERHYGECGYEGKFYSPTLWKRIKTALIGEKNNA